MLPLSLAEEIMKQIKILAASRIHDGLPDDSSLDVCDVACALVLSWPPDHIMTESNAN